MASFGPDHRSMDITGFLADHMGHFSLYDIPNLLFAVLLATLLGYVLARAGGRVQGAEANAAATMTCLNMVCFGWLLEGASKGLSNGA